MPNIIWQPQPKQLEFMSRGEDEALFGGAAGGGKSDAAVMEVLRQIDIPYYKGLIIRKSYPQLSELIDKSQFYYPRVVPGSKYNDSKHTWTFPSGSKIVFGSLNNSRAKMDYQGKAFDTVVFDEVTHFTYDEYIYLMSRNRPNGPGTRCYIRATGNPGNVGHGWVKNRFITAAPPLQTIWDKKQVARPDGSIYTKWLSRVFVPSSVFDNQKLLDNDPDYIARLASLPEAERKALLYGDWDTFEGQYFTEWRDNPEHYKDHLWTHVIEPFEIDPGWKIYRSFDWGYSRPFSCGWWAVDYSGTAYRILEWYGSNGTPNTGLKLNAAEVFKRIHEIECEHRWLKGKKITGVADPAIFAADGGESINEMASKFRVYFSPGDHQRIPGWMQVHYRLAFDEFGKSMMYIFSNCKNTIRTLPTLVFDDTRVEDLNTDGEDHIADDIRYFCMSRPITPRKNADPDEYYNSPLYTVFDIPKGGLKELNR